MLQLGASTTREEVIEINGTSYKLIHNSESTYLLRYNETHKIWVKLTFSDTKAHNTVLDTLKRLYTARIQNTSW